MRCAPGEPEARSAYTNSRATYHGADESSQLVGWRKLWYARRSKESDQRMRCTPVNLRGVVGGVSRRFAVYIVAPLHR